MSGLFPEVRREITSLVDKWEKILLGFPLDLITSRRNQQNRTIKEILGHLVDSAANNHQRMVRLQYARELSFPDYRQDNDLWIRLQNYQQADWGQLVAFWRLYNLHLVSVIGNIDPKCLGNTWRDFEGTAVTLREMVEGYLRHLNLHLDEIKALHED
ncbi:MAG: DinB family protein [Fibrobacteres bacterium]|nr:DinB family protein [Fibrobacterota bacterium]